MKKLIKVTAECLHEERLTKIVKVVKEKTASGKIVEVYKIMSG